MNGLLLVAVPAICLAGMLAVLAVALCRAARDEPAEDERRERLATTDEMLAAMTWDWQRNEEA